MMKLTVFIFVLIISLFEYVQEVKCAAHRIPNATHPDYPGSCYHEDNYLNETFILKAGQKKRLKNKCYQLECELDYSLTALGCGVYRTMQHCRVIRGDLSKPYPYCCDEYVC